MSENIEWKRERERETLVWKKEGEDCIGGGRNCIEEENGMKIYR
jgi:hypothetical protein